jgi:hypothetical protein
MSQNLNFPYVYYQYQNANSLNIILNGIFNLGNDASIQNLNNFFDLDMAEGKWLDQLGLYLGYPRPLLVGNGKIFGYNIGALYNDGYLYNGRNGAKEPANDILYRYLLKGTIQKRNSHFTNEEIRASLKSVLGAISVKIDESNKMLAITCTFQNNPWIKNIINLLNILDPRWFGLPTGVGISSFTVINI